MNLYAFNLDVRQNWLRRKILLIVKLIIIIMTACLLQASASTFAQKITLVKKNATLSEIFTEIRKQTGYYVLYSEDQINVGQMLDVSFRGTGLKQVLDQLNGNSPISYTIDSFNIIITKKEPSLLEQIAAAFSNIDITSQILDEKGKPLAGASLTVKGTTRSVISDKNGVFVFNQVDEKAVIIISFLGYQSREIVAGQIKGPIGMQVATTKLEEVIVTTAYGIERNRKELGYSVVKITGQELTRANSGNILTGLIGKVSGLNISEQTTAMNPQMRILIRGIRSFGETSNNQPLFVLNGSPLSFGSDNDAAQRAAEFISSLNPADVEDVTVLKGANGTAMYGPEGVNGVIIITTKKPKAGEMAVNFRLNNSYQALDWTQDVKQRVFGMGNATNQVGGRSIYSWGPAYDGRMVPIGYPDENGKYQMVPYADRKDSREFWDIAKATRLNLSLSQGDQNSSYYLGLGRLDKTGLLPKDKIGQTTIIMNSSKNFGRKLNVLFNMNYARSADDRGPGIQNDVMATPTFIPLLDYKDYENDHWSKPDNYWNFISPYEAIDKSRKKTNINSLTGSLAVNLKLLPWLNIKEQVGVNYEGNYSKVEEKPLSFAAYSKVNPQKALIYAPSVEDEVSSSYSINNDLFITAIHKTGNFLFRLNTGNSIRESFVKSLSSTASLVVPVYNIVYERDNSLNSNEVSQLSRSISFFGNVNVGYKDRLFLELTGRNEWDSKRARIARGQDMYFGMNASALVKEMVPLLKQQQWLSTFRLRASVAQTANMNIQPNASERRLRLAVNYPFTSTTNDFFGNPVPSGDYLLGYVFDSTNPNPLIRPERVISQEYGAEIGLFANRLKLDASYYFQVNDGVIMKVANSWLSGYPTFDNAGKFQNSGWEFDANLSPLIEFSRDMSISLQGRFAINNNKVLKVSDIYNGSFTALDPSGRIYFAREGHSAFEFALNDWKRDPQGRVIVNKLNGMPEVDSQNPGQFGRTLPVYSGSLTLNFRWKKLTFSAQADYSAGNDHLFNTQTISYGIHPLTLLNNREVFIFPNSVIEESPGNFVENTNVAVSNAGQELFNRFAGVTAHGLTSAAFWKIRELALQYELPVKTKWVKMFNFSIYTRDLYSFYPKSNINGDPSLIDGPGIKRNVARAAVGERANSASNNVSGGSSEAGTLPGTRLFGFTIGASF
jgi:TonB-linked SusC/RagA family outer membrane protein